MPRPARPALFAAVAATVAAVVAACGGPAASVPPPPSGVVVVEAREYRFTPSTVTVGAGKVTFYVRNAGTVEHEFEVFKGAQVVDEVEGLVPGLAKNLTVTLEPGQYTFVCKLSGHDQLGMKGTLTVTGS
jgi:iron uptake system component EfeO